MTDGAYSVLKNLDSFIVTLPYIVYAYIAYKYFNATTCMYT